MSNGELFSWGHNGYGQLGQGMAVTSGNYISLPHQIEGPLNGIPIAKVACGGHHTLALSREGKARAHACTCTCCRCLNDTYTCICMGTPVCEITLQHAYI